MKEEIVLVTQEIWNTINETIPLGKQASQHGILPSLWGKRVILATDADIAMYPALKEYGIYTLTIDTASLSDYITRRQKKCMNVNT